MKNLFLASLLLMLSMSASAYPVTLGDITGNALHTEIDSLDERFQLTDTSSIVDDATAFLLFELAGNHSTNAFGIYGSGTSMQIFGGGATPITSATLAWDILTDEVNLVGTALTAFIDDQDFGFYLDTVDGRFFTESLLNGGLDLAMTFHTGPSGHGDLLGSNYVLAWEDTLMGDLDYNDMVVGISDIGATPRQITTVPEPNPLSLMIMGLGLVGLGAYKRKVK